MESMTARQAWTDDRVDDLVKRVDDGFAQAHGDLKDLRREVGSTREELRAEILSVREEVSSLSNDLRTEIGSVATDLRTEIKSGDQELRTEFDGLRAEMNQHFSALNRRFDLFRATLLAAVLAGLIGILASHLL
jgi:uncharacterized coiled-coil DUF342 family protein